ncbi:molybdopterin converting factor subunit 1 [Metabacillus indicus]|uniref:Molybdopterin synthase sulfur carrier subunit n=1 Tax=Metabacillus indicus TaxID=246786 RepID=A0A084H4A4_METID|nr:molybdopterin converting factor subunit 1 [Metabacillus indicus]KEZ54416.1 molybdenum cofactor biosynthesis protein MoaD [Metabacillus indicus]
MITILLFAHLGDQAGKSTVQMQAAGMTAGEMKESLSETYKLKGIYTAMIAVNEEFADESTVLKDGDTVAFIPPVSGG